MIRSFWLLFVAFICGAVPAVAQNQAVGDNRDSTTALVRIACDSAAPVDLRAFKRRQLERRQSYLEKAISAMSADALANSAAYSIDDRSDFNQTVASLRKDLTVVQDFISKGCSGASHVQTASQNKVVSDASPASSELRPSVTQHSNISLTTSTPSVITDSVYDSPLPQNPVPKTVPTPDSKSESSQNSPAGGGTPGQTQANSGSSSDVKQLQQQVQDIQNALSKQDQDFALVLGLGSLVINPDASDYKNDANVIHTTNLGSATPQLLTGVAFRSHIPSITTRFRRDLQLCGSSSDKSLVTTPAKSGGVKPSGRDNSLDTPAVKKCGEAWQVRPWSGFVSLKFAPGASQVINGYVIGGTYSITKYLDALIGFALTPVNEASPGFRVTASQFVANQQKLGMDLNFNPVAMLANRRNAFDGFPVTDPTGKLIYQGNPLSVHYRGGVVFGVSFPIYFRSYSKTSDVSSGVAH